MIATLLVSAADAARQTASHISTVRPWWQVLLDNGLALSILFIFLTAIVGLVVNQRRRDKCLKLVHDYHVSVVDQSGRVVWGDLVVFSKGLEVVFDAPYRTRRGLFKTSALLHEPQVRQLLAICRPVTALTARERAMRLRQIRRTFRPNPGRRIWRSVRNLLNTLRDAFASAMALLIGQMMRTTAKGSQIATQEKGVTQIGTTLLGAAGNAYEPILERRIGKPVVMQLACKRGEATERIDLPGYLVDYSADYIAVFNVEHEPVESIEVTVDGTTEGRGWAVGLDDQTLTVTCTGPEVLVIKSLRTGARYAKLEAAVPLGAAVSLHVDRDGPTELVMERSRRIDIVAPRSLANIYFGGEFGSRDGGAGQAGVAPEEVVETASDEPVPGDQAGQASPPPADPVAVAEKQA